jgi:AGCS family alanine or glycine:cation symporter
LFVSLIFCIFVIIVAAASLGPIIDLDVLMPIVKCELDSYWSRLKSGEIKKFSWSLCST